MAVTKEVYTLAPGWSNLDVLNQIKQAFIDAGLMTDWYDSFAISTTQCGVIECAYDGTKAFGKTYYVCAFDGSLFGIYAATGEYDAVTHTFTGAQYLDFAQQPSTAISLGIYNNNGFTDLTAPTAYYNTTEFKLCRYTSSAASSQSWFVFANGMSSSFPFAIHRSDVPLYSWLDLDRGFVPGLYRTISTVSANAAATLFSVEENTRRAYPFGQGLEGITYARYAPWHGFRYTSYSYVGSGRANDNYNQNYSNLVGNTVLGKIGLPISSSEANPAYPTDYSPICSELPWTPYSSAPLASDFGVYMHYENNTLNFEDRFVVDPGVEEWEILTYANAANVPTGASPTFLARVV